MIQIDNVTRRYGQVVAVSGVTVSIERGEIVGLLGHNGAGKTTLMKMLTGYLEPSSGTLSVGGRDVVRKRAAAQRSVGYLPESAPLYPEMRVQEYLLMMAELRGVAEDKLRPAVARAARATGLGERMTQRIGTLSKGFRQRVGIAQAIVHDPDVLVLDEPTNGLDPVQIQSIRTLIRDLAKDTTVLLSTHILQEVEAVCDRVLVLIDGNLVADAALESLLSSRTLRLSLARPAEGVEHALMQLDGVTSASATGDSSWAIECAQDGWPTTAILSLAADRQWEIEAIGPETRTLDGVFRKLQADHVARAGSRP